MNTVNMPGFAAEASLSGASGRYHTLESAAAQAAGGVVLSQFCHTNLDGMTTECCYCYGVSCWCEPVKKKLLTLLGT